MHHTAAERMEPLIQRPEPEEYGMGPWLDGVVMVIW